jgi:hypothetical protein
VTATSTRAWTRSLLRQPVRLPVDGRGRTTGDELRTTGARQPVQKERQEASGFAAYWEDFWSNADVFYGHFLGFKAWSAMPSCCVSTKTEVASATGSSLRRAVPATDRLVVVGDPDVIERACGRDVREGLLRQSARHASRPAKNLAKKVK